MKEGMKENEKRLKPKKKKKENPFSLNLLAEQAYEVCKKRGKDSGDTLDFLKYLAGEVVEATEAYKNSAYKNSAGVFARDIDFALELADVIMTCLIIMHKCGINARSALILCHTKNMGKIQKEGGGE